MTKTRFRSGTVSTYVDLDVEDVLAEVSDEALLEEVAERKLSTPEPKGALMLAIEAEHAEAHPWGPTWLCRAGVCGRIDWANGGEQS